eukprot:m.140467 g.140467  ORF g.140467 m.140467 type:complete len:169 (-) comp17085_c1_seq1:51-557(-)
MSRELERLRIDASEALSKGIKAETLSRREERLIQQQLDLMDEGSIRKERTTAPAPSRELRKRKKRRKTVKAKPHFLPEPAVEPEGDAEYTVEELVGSKLEDDVVKYFVKWEGWGSDDNTWEPFEHFNASMRHSIRLGGTSPFVSLREFASGTIFSKKQTTSPFQSRRK